jgi:hypothetical protein
MSFLSKKTRISMRGKYQWWSVITYVMFGIMVGSILFSSMLIYNYTFRTLEDAHTIVLLNADSMVNNVNLDMYKKAVEAISLKNSIMNHPADLRNIFVYNTSTAALQPVTTHVPTSSTPTPTPPSYVPTVN